MTIEAKIIADSLGANQKRLTTFVLRYPRFIHSELMTHRMLSRNASSSRAIPVKKIIQAVIDEPALPEYWGAEQKGMQSGEELDNETRGDAIREWLLARDHAVTRAKVLMSLNVHKSLINRILEPFSHISVVCTATDWANFFHLRWHKDAQPEFRILAEKMAEIYRNSVPRYTTIYEWHLPFVSDQEKEKFKENALKLSVARCARVSYLNHDGTQPDYDADMKLHDRLMVQTPLHASPAEHQAYPCNSNCNHGNFSGWHQYRKTFKNENVTHFPWERGVEN